MDQNQTQIIIALLGVANTALLVYQAVRLNSVHQAVNSAKDAAVLSATLAGHAAGVAEVAARPDAPKSS